MAHFSSDNSSSADQVPSWLITFADAMSLLLSFFVLLFSFTDISIETIIQYSPSGAASTQVQEKSDIDATERADAGGQTGEEETGASDVKQGELTETKKDTESPRDKGTAEEEFGSTYLKKVFAKGVRHLNRVAEVDIEELEDGYNIFFNLKRIFKKDQAIIAPGKEQVVKKLAELLSKLPNDIIVESFYIPKSKEQEAALELAIKRIEYIANFLIEEGGLIPSRVGVSESSAFTDLYYTYSWRQRRKYSGIRIVVSAKNEGYKFFLKQTKQNGKNGHDE